MSLLGLLVLPKQKQKLSHRQEPKDETHKDRKGLHVIAANQFAQTWIVLIIWKTKNVGLAAWTPKSCFYLVSNNISTAFHRHFLQQIWVVNWWPTLADSLRHD